MKDFSQYVLGAKRSPVDNRDWNYEHILGKMSVVELPETLDWRTSMFGVRDQEQQGSCVAMAGAAMKDWQEAKDVNINEYMSPQFIYNNREDLSEEGMVFRDLMNILMSVGTCKESTFPYGYLTTPPQPAYEEAKDYVIKGYAQVYTIEGLKKALFENGPCVIGIPVYNTTPRLWYQRPNDYYLGGHAITVVGYNVEGFIIRNSWGTDWGNEGYTIFPYTDWGMQWETWTSVDAETGVVPDPDPAPDPTPNGCLNKFGMFALIAIAVLYSLTDVLF